jgi:hypothetical protein
MRAVFCFSDSDSAPKSSYRYFEVKSSSHKVKSCALLLLHIVMGGFFKSELIGDRITLRRGYTV